MAYEQKPNSGSLWPNNRKEKPTHPDLTGTIEVAGVLYWISAWEKNSNGKPWLSISVKPKEAQAAPAADAPAPSAGRWSQTVAEPKQAPLPNVPQAADDSESVPF
jgi:hypothetical protein